MLLEPEFLGDFTREVVRKAASEVSVKIRGNVPEADTVLISEILDQEGCSYIHLDAMKPGVDRADLELVSRVSGAVRRARIIGNNSIRDLRSARAMLDAGADGVSVARAALSGRLSFSLSKL